MLVTVRFALRHLGRAGVAASLAGSLFAAAAEPFDAPYSVEYEERMAARMKEGIDSFLDAYLPRVVNGRDRFWQRDLSSSEAYAASVDPNRERLRKLIGATDARPAVRLWARGEIEAGAVAGETEHCTIYEVEWTVLKGLSAEGLLLVPKREVKASAVVIPDADESPESYAGLEPGPGLALRLAEAGVRVIVPVLVNRDTRYSGQEAATVQKPWQGNADPVPLWTKQPHREWIHRQGYIMGRHLIGLEAQKVMAAVDWLASDGRSGSSGSIGIMGNGEGGLLALYSAALDSRIDAAWVRDYFGPREGLWREPYYRNIWGLLAEFGDAEIASLIVPRPLVLEGFSGLGMAHQVARRTPLPNSPEGPSAEEVEREFNRLVGFFSENQSLARAATYISGTAEGSNEEAWVRFATALGMGASRALSASVRDRRAAFEPQERQRRTVYNLVEYIQDLIRTSDRVRYGFLKGDFSSPEAWDEDMEPYRKHFYEELVGRISEPLLPLNPKVRQVYDEPGWKGYEVVLDVWPGVFAWGVLAVPDGIAPGERRPAVVLQHGHAGLPSTPVRVASYNRVLPALVNRGFVVFSPHAPYGLNVRKANPMKASVYSVFIPQHEQILSFLNSLDYVDESRIALYGKSWGGRTAQRVPIVLKGYSVAISSAYFNDWPRKTASVDYRNSYLFSGSIGVYEWNMGNTLCHAEMAALIAPRPFMVESGYHDGVAAHERVAYEFAKVRRWYDLMGIGERAELEFFEGGHEINGEGTFRFLHRHLAWPRPDQPTEAQNISRSTGARR